MKVVGGEVWNLGLGIEIYKGSTADTTYCTDWNTLESIPFGNVMAEISCKLLARFCANSW